MATKTTTEEDRKAAWRYQKELPEDATKLQKAWKLLESYSGIPRNEIDAHVIEVVCLLPGSTPILS